MIKKILILIFQIVENNKTIFFQTIDFFLLNVRNVLWYCELILVLLYSIIST